VADAIWQTACTPALESWRVTRLAMMTSAMR